MLDIVFFVWMRTSSNPPDINRFEWIREKHFCTYIYRPWAFHLLHLLLFKILVLGCLFTGMIVFNFYTALLTSNSGEIIIIIWFIFEKNKHLKFCSVNTNTASKVEKFKDIANKGMKVV